MPPEIWGPYTLLPENLKLFRECVKGAADDMLTTHVVDYEWMAYYDDHCHNIDGDKEIEGQCIDNDYFAWNVHRYHKYLLGRTGPEWGVVTRSPWEEVSFKTTEKTKMKDFRKKVLPYILEHPSVQKVYYVRMRIVTQWRDYKLPRLIS